MNDSVTVLILFTSFFLYSQEQLNRAPCIVAHYSSVVVLQEKLIKVNDHGLCMKCKAALTFIISTLAAQKYAQLSFCMVNPYNVVIHLHGYTF